MLSNALTRKDKFKFLCHKDIECFNKCCYDLNLFLTPYDIVRLKNNLKISSSEFLKRYTTWHIGVNTELPVVVLKMKGDLTCPFVSKDGCTVYKDRPSSCRLYPLARVKVGNEEYYYIVKEEHCMGFNENKTWTVEEWLIDQETEIYNIMNDHFMKLVEAKQKSKKKLNRDEMELFYMTCFDIDRFRHFAIENEIIKENLNDVELMYQGIVWLKKTLFNV